MDPRQSYRLGDKIFGALDALTPLGNMTMAADAGTQFRNGHPLMGAGLGALAILPGAAGKGVRKAGGMFASRVFHASPKEGLDRILAAPTERQYDNATSQFGAFFAPSPDGAKRYGSHLYETNLQLKNPHEMAWRDFDYFQSPHKLADGSPAPDWAARAEELKAEAAALRDKLSRDGHDGIVVRGSRGQPVEIASFNDVPLKK
jgi:hypothetical protein